MKILRFRLAFLALALLVSGGVGSAHAQMRTLTIIPALAEGVSMPGQRIGPIAIRNATGERYAVSVHAVLLGQRQDGGIFVRADAAARRRGARLLRIAGQRGFWLPTGKSRSVSAVLVRRSVEHNFYGGVLFEATPTPRTSSSSGSGLVYAFQLNARLLLRPPRPLQRPALELGGIRGEQAGERRVSLFAEVVNEGNIALVPRGVVRLRDADGDVRFRRRLPALLVLPGAAVDLSVRFARPLLPAGRYVAEVAVEAPGGMARARETIEFLGPNELPTRRAKIVRFEPPQAFAGEEATVSATYRNTGNVPFRPETQLAVSTPEGVVAMEAEEVEPGAEARAEGSVELPGTEPRELTVRLLVDGRELDSRTVTVTPVERPPLAARVQDWVTRSAVPLVIGLLAVVLVLAGAVTTVAVRRR